MDVLLSAEDAMCCLSGGSHLSGLCLAAGREDWDLLSAVMEDAEVWGRRGR